MIEFWERNFREIETMWGYDPADSAIRACEFFKINNVKNILIPGFGYGRNAKVFLNNGICVTGIEISETAIRLAREKNGLDILIHHGSVIDMPFDKTVYEGLFCYALIHLLNRNERKQFIESCFNQLQTNGYMIFVAVSKKAEMYGNGRQLSKNRFEVRKGVKVYFYDLETAAQEFKNYGLVDVQEYDEPIKYKENHPPLRCIVIRCKK